METLFLVLVVGGMVGGLISWHFPTAAAKREEMNRARSKPSKFNKR